MLAIVVPYYKLTFFEATLLSLADQADKRFKVYIGDDASPQNPRNLLERYEGKFDFLYHRFESNLGGTSLVKHWERCIALTNNEEWIMILGDDDILDNSVIASWYKNYVVFNQKSELIRFATKWILEESKSVSEIFIHPVWENATDSFYRKFQYLTRSSLSEYVFSRASYLKYGFFDYLLAWHSDDRAWLDFSDKKPIFTINESVVFVRISRLSISGKVDNDISKRASAIAFNKFIVSTRLDFYNKKQREILMRRYENEIKKVGDISFSDWSFLFLLYLKYPDINSFRKFIKRFLNNILKRHEF
ncbi:glycosyltransferase [Flavobacterium sp. ZS1P14]|uniref:glycosyltransferase n=1 Tax=Flavobacterium sp. ZS1P14 TaxID=3401729 RepID=UPI003AAC716B